MPIFKKNDITIFFSHIPKTGGSSISDFIGRNKYHRYFFSGHISPCSLQHRHRDDRELIEELGKHDITYSFCFMRDPLGRMISEYYMRRNNIDYNNENDFEEFVRHMFNEYRINPYVQDNHIRPQHEFIHKNMKVFKFGQWEKLFDDLKKIEDFDLNNFFHLNCSTEFENSYNYMDKQGWKPNKKTIELIENFYKEDYKILNNESIYGIQ